ncbi:hypothetical protein MKZ20_00165 [Psychrobacillus sp. FSL K6-2684]|uniref:hypothetical protein n=1 Tax=unclassified Psychrobacillus TaxID=2636677 RepID=UPI001244D157|nr:hypothetical protein [Psychrobacillus sp. AK 1817]
MCEKAEGQRVRGSKEERLGAYSIRENRSTAADKEICRPSGFAAEPMVVGGPPARVGRRWALEKVVTEKLVTAFLFVL